MACWQRGTAAAMAEHAVGDEEMIVAAGGSEGDLPRGAKTPRASRSWATIKRQVRLRAKLWRPLGRDIFG